MSSPSPLEPDGPERIEPYRLAGVLGEGGQGTVYLGHSASGAPVAIKVLHARMAADADELRRFARETDIAGLVATFCTANVIDVGTFRGRPYIVSEYIPGPSLQELVKSEGPRTGSGLERLAVATLTALEAIHRAGIIHRDLKPANVIMGPEGPVVIDFGIARLLDQVTTRSGIVGTPAYMAPEQFQGQVAAPASDVFSWAATMVFAATGQAPYPGVTPAAVIHAIMTRDPDLTGVPDPLQSLMLSCLAKDPDARPTPQELLARLTTRHLRPQHNPRVSAEARPTDATGDYRRSPNPNAVGPASQGTGAGAPDLDPGTTGGRVSPPSHVSGPSAASAPTDPVRPRGRGRGVIVASAVTVPILVIGIVFAVVQSRKDHIVVGGSIATPVAMASNTTTPPAPESTTSATTPPPAAASEPAKSASSSTGSAPSRRPKSTHQAPRTSPSSSAPSQRPNRTSKAMLTQPTDKPSAASDSPRRSEVSSEAPQPPPSGGHAVNISTNYAWARGSVSWNGTTATASGSAQDTKQYESRSWLRIAYRKNVGGVWKVHYAERDPWAEVSNGEHTDFEWSIGGPVKDVQWDLCSNRSGKTYCTGWK
ncbi:Serine/threonine protein kinase [Streptosporangium subroseum]|uniref:Serine/threonine protein kinase n=1 Tax=Streptosporangium subroseum TaxID=106412 RepID=A0A239EE02_9ACTN|nr:serine/threonine-protein kinase [Streptosporangium subroseum]SNS42759.1 Serine/threonine protein kinase [Streptosporangium subroseum]